MIYFGLLFVETFILFLFSRSMSKTLSGFMSVNMLSFIFLPGVIIHELSHLFIAMILFVPVGSMEFIPKKHGNGVKLGSVEIAKTDPVRRSIIGFAPVFVGLMIVIGAVYLFTANLLFFRHLDPYIFIVMVLVFIYLLFAVSNTMFSSTRDMEGTAEILITLLIISGAAYLLGFRIPPTFLTKIFTEEQLEIIYKATLFLLAPIMIDSILLGTIKTFNYTRNRKF